MSIIATVTCSIPSLARLECAMRRKSGKSVTSAQPHLVSFGRAIHAGTHKALLVLLVLPQATCPWKMLTLFTCATLCKKALSDQGNSSLPVCACRMVSA